MLDRKLLQYAKRPVAKRAALLSALTVVVILGFQNCGSFKATSSSTSASTLGLITSPTPIAPSSDVIITSPTQWTTFGTANGTLSFQSTSDSGQTWSSYNVALSSLVNYATPVGRFLSTFSGGGFDFATFFVSDTSSATSLFLFAHADAPNSNWQQIQLYPPPSSQMTSPNIQVLNAFAYSQGTFILGGTCATPIVGCISTMTSALTPAVQFTMPNSGTFYDIAIGNDGCAYAGGYKSQPVGILNDFYVARSCDPTFSQWSQDTANTDFTGVAIADNFIQKMLSADNNVYYVAYSGAPSQGNLVFAKRIASGQWQSQTITPQFRLEPTVNYFGSVKSCDYVVLYSNNSTNPPGYFDATLLQTKDCGATWATDKVWNNIGSILNASVSNSVLYLVTSQNNQGYVYNFPLN